MVGQEFALAYLHKWQNYNPSHINESCCQLSTVAILCKSTKVSYYCVQLTRPILKLITHHLPSSRKQLILMHL